MALVLVYRREEGFIVKSGNPLGVKFLEDLVRTDIQFVNREPGSGVRQWLDLHFNRLGIQPEMVPGYLHVVNSHTEVAQAVRGAKPMSGSGSRQLPGNLD